MQIVINIPDGCYEELNSGRFPVQDAYRLVAWIKNGTPLPKGHGRLIDVDEVIKIANKKKDLHGAIWNAPTIIEADKTERNDKE